MPVFRRTDPDLRSLIAYLVARSREREITLNQTKLVKLLYLIDVERVRSRLDPLTGLQWVFFHYGPYALELPETLEAMEGTQVVTRRWGDSLLYQAAPGAPDGDDWPRSTRSMVDRVVQRFAPMEVNELLDHVYFHTGPMVGAVRGQPLDLSRARDYQEPHRQRALEAPDKPANLEQRLAEWRERNGRLLARLTLDPPGRFFDDPDDDLDGGSRGRLSVPDDTTL
jgi:hypothetical protein